MTTIKDLKSFEDGSSVSKILCEYFDCDESSIIDYMFNDGIASSLCWCEENHIELDDLLDIVETSLHSKADFKLTDSYNSVLLLNKSISLPMNWFIQCD